MSLGKCNIGIPSYEAPLSFPWSGLCFSDTVVEQSIRNLMVEGSNPAIGTGRDNTPTLQSLLISENFHKKWNNINLNYSKPVGVMEQYALKNVNSC
jgi:hypothetical protein